jgi:hypothetical protein
MEIIVGVIALGIAIWQLHLQRKEIRLNGKINSLIHMAVLLKDKINYYEKIIQTQKENNKEWTGHAYRVNSELRPALEKVNKELFKAMSGYQGEVNMVEIKKCLRLDEV